MKRILLLALAGCFFFASMAGAKELQLQGEFIQGLEWHNNLDFTEKNTEDDFEARQNTSLSLHYVASEQLRGVLGFEIDSAWGVEGGLGTDTVNIEVNHAYVDFLWGMVQVRTGLQPFALPGAVAGSMILDEDGAGITASMQFNEKFGLTVAWLHITDDSDKIHDAMDAFMIVLPITTDNFKMTLFGVYASISTDAVFPGSDPAVPLGMTDAHAYWLGSDFILDLDDFELAADLNYGAVSTDVGAKEASGIWIDGRLTYNGFESFTPSFIFWYGSGNDDNPGNGSEVMPVIAPSFEGTSLGFGDSPDPISSDILGNGLFGSTLSSPGLQATLAGGVAADFSFMDNLDHTARIVFGVGTNDKDLGSSQWQLTTEDSFYELNFHTSYQLYESLELWNYIAYLGLNLDDEAGEEDAFRFALGLTYTY